MHIVSTRRCRLVEYYRCMNAYCRLHRDKQFLKLTHVAIIAFDCKDESTSRSNSESMIVKFQTNKFI